MFPPAAQKMENVYSLYQGIIVTGHYSRGGERGVRRRKVPAGPEQYFSPETQQRRSDLDRDAYVRAGCFPQTTKPASVVIHRERRSPTGTTLG